MWGQVPVYYQSSNLNLTGDLLKNELSNLIINTHQNLIPYTSSNSIDTWDIIKSSDVFAFDTSKVMLVYGYDDNDAIVKMIELEQNHFLVIPILFWILEQRTCFLNHLPPNLITFNLGLEQMFII